MDKLFEGERAFLTGGGSRIGRACALALAAEGCFVTFAGRTESTLNDTVSLIAEAGVRGTFHGMKHELDLMQGQGVVSILNIGSGAGLLGVPGHSGYVASKPVAIGLTKSAALEWFPIGLPRALAQTLE